MATGFIAKNPQGQVTTLKRNGSDYSATIMGALVRGSHITIWTDVDGVFSADPRKVSMPCVLSRSRLSLSRTQGIVADPAAESITNRQPNCSETAGLLCQAAIGKKVVTKK